MCRGDRPVAPTGVGDGDQPGCADWERRLSSAKDEAPENGHFRKCLCNHSGMEPESQFFRRTIVFLTAPLAQLVEQRTLNPRVGGSSPPGCTTEFPLSSPERVSSVCFLRSAAAIQSTSSVFSCNVRLSAETPVFVSKERCTLKCAFPADWKRWL